MKKKLNINQLSYLKLIIDLSDEIGISILEAKNIVDTAITLINPQIINYKKHYRTKNHCISKYRNNS